MTTYLEAVNKLARKVNEVQIPEADFATVIGVHGALKDGIIDSLSKIYQKKYKWPFLATEKTQVLTVGDQEYPWEDNFLSVDWNSFQIQKDDDLNVKSRHLKAIEREEWYRNFRDADVDAGAEGKDIPSYVFSNHGRGYGLSPSPNEEYTVKYRYFANPVIPSAASDVIAVPKEFEYVIMAGGLYHAYLFYDNNERATIAKQEFDDGLKDMVLSLIGNNFEHVYSGYIEYAPTKSRYNSGL